MVTSKEFEEIDKESIEGEKPKQITEDIELKNELFQVKGSLKKNITQDYTLAHLNKDEREFITENYQNAEFAKNLLERFGDKGWRFVWDEKAMDWVRNSDGMPVKVNISETEKKYIQKLANRTFEFFMIQPHMIAILNRNRNENFLVKLLGKNKDEDEESKPMAMLDQKSFVDKIKDAFSREEVLDEGA